MSKTLGVIALATASLAGQGCYKGRVVAFPPPTPGEMRKDVPPGTFDKTQKVNLYFWGLLQKPPSPVLAENCPTQSMKEVTVTRKGSYVAAAVFTLGIYSAIDISWQCAQQPSKQGGEIGGPTPKKSAPVPPKKEDPAAHADR
ncbi:MAG: Bor family protein [Acidobacteriia bacterium]|nr:Bor family protein [Terriglobia bacterium]